MNKYKDEYLEEIKEYNDGKKYIHTTIPYEYDLSLISDDGLIFLSDPNNYINKYLDDERRYQFPYNNIPSHKGKVNGKIYNYVNQILDDKKVYIGISDGMLKQYYVMRIYDKPYLITKLLVSKKIDSRIMTMDDVNELIKDNGNLYSIYGIKYNNFKINEEEVIEYYQEILNDFRSHEIEAFKDSDSYVKEYYPNNWFDFINNMISRVSIDDIPYGMFSYKDLIKIDYNSEGIDKITGYNITFLSKDKYQVKIYNFPVDRYNMSKFLYLIHHNCIGVSDIKISRLLNHDIKKEDIVKAKKLILARKKEGGRY